MLQTNPHFRVTEAETKKERTGRLASINSRLSITSFAIPIKSLLTSRVIVAILNYALVSLIDMSYRAVRPSVFGSPVGMGGLGLEPPIIGKMFACEGVMNGLFQILFFKKIHDRLAGGSTKALFLWCVPMAILVFWSFPIMARVAELQGKDVEGGWLVYGVYAIQTFFFVFFNMASGEPVLFLPAFKPA